MITIKAFKDMEKFKEIDYIDGDNIILYNFKDEVTFDVSLKLVKKNTIIFVIANNIIFNKKVYICGSVFSKHNVYCNKKSVIKSINVKDQLYVKKTLKSDLIGCANLYGNKINAEAIFVSNDVDITKLICKEVCTFSTIRSKKIKLLRNAIIAKVGFFDNK